MWFFFALTSALFYSFRGILEKRIIHKTNKYILGFAIRFFALPFFFVPFFIQPSLLAPIAHLNSQFWFALFMVCVVGTPIETVLYYEALKNEEISLVLPILSLAPALTIIWGSLFLREIPTTAGILGILFVTLGIYALKIGHAKDGVFAPIHHLRNNRAVRLMFIVMISLSFGSIFDKMGVTNSNAFFYSAANYIGVSFVLFLLVLLKARTHIGDLKKQVIPFMVIGIFVAGYTFLYSLALQSGFASYSIAIKNASILFTILFSLIFLKEKEGWSKILAGALIFIGLVCIKVFS